MRGSEEDTRYKELTDVAVNHHLASTDGVEEDSPPARCIIPQNQEGPALASWHLQRIVQRIMVHSKDLLGVLLMRQQKLQHKNRAD